MQYLVTFLEGIITFVSPCLLPMLPIYVSYFAGDAGGGTKKTLRNALGFTLGFTLVFITLGALSGVLGSFLREYKTWVNIACGLIVIFFGLCFLGVIKLNIFRGGSSADVKNLGFFSSMLFGITFSISWTPCVGAFLGSALMLASQEGSVLKGILLLLCFSAGLGIPFVVSALLIEKLKTVFGFIKKHYKIINIICGCFLIIVGVLMAFGLLGAVLSKLA